MRFIFIFILLRWGNTSVIHFFCVLGGRGSTKTNSIFQPTTSKEVD